MTAVALCDACGHAEHDAWDCRHRWDEKPVPCMLCLGDGCEEGCGECHETPSVAGPDAHRQCIRCHGAGVVFGTRCACDRGHDGDGDLETDDRTDRRTRGEIEAARIRSKAHGAERQQWDV